MYTERFARENQIAQVNMSGSFQSVETLLSTLGSFSDSRSLETSPSASQTRITISLSTAVPQQLNVVEQLEARGNGEPPSYTSVDPDWSIPIEYVQDAGQSLPALTEELADAQKTQNKELLRREEQLETLQVTRLDSHCLHNYDVMLLSHITE